MRARIPFKRLILRAVLRNVSPMVIRVMAVPDYLDLPDLDEVFRTILEGDGLGFRFHVHGQEFSSLQRATRSKTLAISNCVHGRSFSILAEPSMFGNGSVECWTSRREPTAMGHRCA